MTTFPPKKILFAVDFSDRARSMARSVRALAQHCDAEVKVLHVLAAEEHNAPVPRAADARQRLNALISEDLAGCNVVVYLTPGDPGSTIVSVARQGSDLIMMPTSGHGAFVRSLIGSVTAQVVHSAPCPIWTSAHEKSDRAFQERGIKTILCAVDLSSRSSLVLQTAIRTAELCRSEVRLVHVMELSHSSTRADWTAERREQTASAVEEQLRQLARSSGGTPTIEVLEGSPVKDVIGAAERSHADLIVLGRTQVLEREGWPTSTGYGIIAASHCSVLNV